MQTKIVSKNFEIPRSHTMDIALKNGRYTSLDRLFMYKPQEVIDVISQSGLRGKGGGGAGAAGKWQLASDQDGIKYVVVQVGLFAGNFPCSN